MKAKDHPGVYFPPPLLYVAIFLISIAIQKQLPLPVMFFQTNVAFISGVSLVVLGLTIMLPAVIRFFKTRNTLVTIKPANSLQTAGIYTISRNPMYLGLLILYVGIAFLKGSLWTFMFIPVVILGITYLVIVKEEKYLSRAFGDNYVEYRKRVRRWI